MSDDTDLTVSLPAEIKAQLAELSRHTRRDQSILGAEAIADYVTRELAIVDAIERGRADARAGRVIPHTQVTGEARTIIERARTNRGA